MFAYGKKLTGLFAIAAAVTFTLSACGSTQPTNDALAKMKESNPDLRMTSTDRTVIDALGLSTHGYSRATNDQRLQMMAHGICVMDQGHPNAFGWSLDSAQFNALLERMDVLSGMTPPPDLVINKTANAFKRRVDTFKAMENCGE